MSSLPSVNPPCPQDFGGFTLRNLRAVDKNGPLTLQLSPSWYLWCHFLSAHHRSTTGNARIRVSQAEILQDTSALAEEGHTPRQEFVRGLLAAGRVPIPILLRDPSALQDLNLAHKGLGDDVMCAAAEVIEISFAREQRQKHIDCGCEPLS